MKVSHAQREKAFDGLLFGFALIVIILLCLFGCTGCNAIAGLGTDLSRSASWIDRRINSGMHSSSPNPYDGYDEEDIREFISRY